MILELIIIATLILLFIYSNPRTTPQESTSQPMFWDRITFNPIIKAPECPKGCKKYSFSDGELSPSVLVNDATQNMCGYRQYESDSIIYPCPSTCCSSSSLPAY